MAPDTSAPPRCPFSGLASAPSSAEQTATTAVSDSKGVSESSSTPSGILPTGNDTPSSQRERLLSEDTRPFIERAPSNIFDGFTPLALLKSFSPAEVILGLGVLFSALLCLFLPPTALFAIAALLLLPPLLRALSQTKDPNAPAVRYGVHMGKIEGEFCVFLLGARANKPWIFNKQFGFVGKNFRQIMRELERLPASAGYLGGEMFTSSNLLRGSHVMAVTYWRSYNHMIKYTYDRGLSHMGAINDRDRLFSGDMKDCGIWHEAYAVKPGQYETVYLNCPPLHLGAASGTVPAVGALRHAAGRVKSTLGPSDSKSDESEKAPQ